MEFLSSPPRFAKEQPLGVSEVREGLLLISQEWACDMLVKILWLQVTEKLFSAAALTSDVGVALKLMPTLEVRGGSRGAAPCPRSGRAMAERSSPRPRWGAAARGATTRPKSGRWPRRATPRQGAAAAGARRAEMSYSVQGQEGRPWYPLSKVRSSCCTLPGSREEITNVQGKEKPK